MCYKGEICGHTFERQDDGTFLYKAKESQPLTKSNVKKAQYKERPQYPLIEQYEKKALQRYQNDLKSLAINIVELLKK